MCRRLLIPFGLLLILAGCTVPDDTVNIDVGNMRPSVADPDLATQVVEVGDNVTGTIQNIVWNEVSIFRIDGLAPDATCDLNQQACLADPAQFGPPLPCAFIDTALVPPQFDGLCGTGLIVNAGTETAMQQLVPVLITLSGVQVSRLQPLPLPAGSDYDGDGLMNAADNCVLVANPGQEDTGMKGFGDACTSLDPFVGLPFVDNDADGVIDLLDNCVYTPNPDQADDGIPFGSSMRAIPDGIGNACDAYEQTAGVELNGSTTIELRGLMPTTGVQAIRSNSWLTLDFNDEAALSCDWDAGTCALSEGALRFCFDLSGGLGCPE